MPGVRTRHPASGHLNDAPRRSETPLLAASPAGHLNDTDRRFDAQVAADAAGWHGVAGLAELVAVGLSARAIQHRVRSGRLFRVHHGVYAVVPPSFLSVEGRYRAATLACTGSRHRAAISHRSAAALHQLRECRRAVVEVIVPGRSTHRHPGIQVHRSNQLHESDLEIVDGVLVTSVARTCLDLAAVVPRRGLERALDQAEILGVLDVSALIEQTIRNPRHPGTGHLRAMLEAYRAGDAPTASALEERFWSLCQQMRSLAGISLPEVNAYVDLGDGGVMIRPDCIWRERKLAVELDGARTHLTRHGFEEDRRRDQRLTAAGWRVIRITWRQLDESASEITRLLISALLGA